MARKQLQSFRLPSFRDRLSSIGIRNRYSSLQRILARHPFFSFFAALSLLFVLIALGSYVSSLSKKETKRPTFVKDVSVYKVGSHPTVTLQAKIEKEGVVQIVAQTAGVVQTVHKRAGETVTKGNLLVSMSSNYAGANAPSLQRQLAATQYKNVKETFDTQKELIKKQRDVAEKTDENNDELRDISKRSLDDTRGLLTLNESMLQTLNTNLQNLQNTNVGGANDALILQTQQLVAQSQAGVNQLRGATRQLELQTDDNKPPTELQQLQKDIALKQLDIQDKALDLNKEVSRLQVSLAAVGESLMFPVSPTTGTVEKIFVSAGDTVTPGTPLAVISGTTNTITATVQVPRTIALTVSRAEASTLHLNGDRISIVPYYVSSNATDGTLYSLFYAILPEHASKVANNEYVTIDVPVGVMQSETAMSYIPIDSVYQTQHDAYVFVAKNGKAITKKIQLGDVYGRYVTVKNGLSTTDQIIVNRNVVSGDSVKIR